MTQRIQYKIKPAHFGTYTEQFTQDKFLSAIISFSQPDIWDTLDRSNNSKAHYAFKGEVDLLNLSEYSYPVVGFLIGSINQRRTTPKKHIIYVKTLHHQVHNSGPSQRFKSYDELISQYLSKSPTPHPTDPFNDVLSMMTFV